MKHLLTCTLFCILTVFGFVVAAPGVQAADFIPLVGIPGINTQTSASLPGYINALYTAAISIAAFMAVVKIIFAGVKYMLSDIVTTKEDAKKDIRGALIGLLIVLGAVLILNTINPQLKGLTALDGLTGVNVTLTGNQTDCSVQPMPPSCCAEGENYWIVGEIGFCAASNDDVDEQILDGELAEELGDGTVLTKYTLEDLPEDLNPEDRSTWIDENWFQECMYVSTEDNTETGNEWFESTTGNGMLWACITP